MKLFNTKLQHKTLEIVGLFLIIVIFFFGFSISYNEMDVIPYARATFNDNWIPNDWYLNLNITYRYLFSYIIGFFAETFGTIPTIIAGRLISYVLISLSLLLLIRLVYGKSYNAITYLALVLLFTFFPNGNGAEEWMVGGLETKVFSYAFSILALAMFLEKRMKLGFLFAGLMLSFHLLIGIYSIFCLIPIFFFYQRDAKKFYLDAVKAFPIFIITGSIGIYGIVHQLFFSESSASNIGWDIYVNLRVPHHTLPNFFPFELWIKMMVFTAINIGFTIKLRNQKIKLISYYALFSVIISLIGIIVFWISDANHNLKYYFFRFSDTTLPLITLLNVSYFLNEKIKKSPRKVQNILSYTACVIMLLFVAAKAKGFTANFTSNNIKFKTHTSDDVAMENWVKNNTDNTKTFIVPPNMSFFYINFERSAFVTWKHSPQNEADIVEWYCRLKLLNQNEDFKYQSEIYDNYYKLTKKDILIIAKKYPNANYFLTSSATNLSFPVLFKSDKFTLYKIRTLANKT
ncbi:hypothetical protein BTO04_04395 [Polaribacter sp. SA4-10]|uniref:DUF6798 domain-containing protein n=1 Tax=Polaribacter sp. SA4-10 TaxID=754397 RepID=UPI000B3C5C94|nr:DUF6798 domain-containing protein [Polaribacter sp. SA4-10]ARV05986.1 hypothetical protein BTO04_04395 [Polaribacter sp. SA4-10]